MDKYIIRQTECENLNIYSEEWDNANIAEVTRINWNEFPDCPCTEVRALYNDKGIYLKFYTDEENIVANLKKFNDHVCEDSACEFFFQPNAELPYYFNFEINAVGTLHIAWGSGRGDRILIYLDDISLFEIESKIYDRGFSVKMFIPYSFLLSYVEEINTEYFLGNFYKCCETKNPPHFATYYPVNTESPDFHSPQYFDRFIFER